jgi:hypothetical protein
VAIWGPWGSSDGCIMFVLRLYKGSCIAASYLCVVYQILFIIYEFCFYDSVGNNHTVIVL